MPQKCISPSSSPKQSEVSVLPPIVMESLMGQILERADPIISKWAEDSSAYSNITSLFYENHEEAREFVRRVSDLHKAMQTLVGENTSSQMLVRAQKLMQMAMKRLQKEFYQILVKNKAYLDPESVSTRLSTSTFSSSPASARSSSMSGYDSDDEIRAAEKVIIETENASAAAMDDLVLIAECMISSGYGRECVHTYKSMRKSIVDEGVKKLYIVKESGSKIRKMDWEALDLKIKIWLDAINVIVNTLFEGERVLCDHVFASASDLVREACFNEITKDAAKIMFEFPEKVVKNSKKHPEKIFRAMEMYTSLASNWSRIESIFSSESTCAFTNLALKSTVKLGDSVRNSLTDFETSVQKDSSKAVDVSTDINSLTTSVMSVLSRLANYNVLEDILFDYTTPAVSPLPVSFYDTSDSTEFPAMTTAVSLRLTRIILVLLCKLDVKARLYKDVSHSYLFLANNLNYIISNVRTSNLTYHLGDEWIAMHEAKVKRFTENYQRLGWSHVIETLQHTNDGDDVKEKMKKFNVAFGEAHRKQCRCVVEDSKLRDEIKRSIADKVLPLYRNLYYAAHGKETGDFVGAVRLGPEGLGHALSDLFIRSGSPSSTAEH